MTDITLPTDLLTLLDGSLPARHRHQAIYLSSIGDNGWPYAAQISLGEIIARSPQQLLFAIWPASTTTANLKRNGKITLALVLDGVVVEVQALAELQPKTLTALKLTVFVAHVRQVISHRAPYATVSSGMTFSLKDETTTVARWHEQIAALKAMK